jgi:hypothetical protein
MTSNEVVMRTLPFLRRGTALFVTLIVCAGFAALAIAAVDRMVGMRQITTVDLAKQRAGAAADAVASMIESKLMDAAADYAKLVTSVDNDPNLATNPWWRLNGCVYKDAAGVMHGPGYEANDAQGKPSKPLWVNGCLVRWMVEPVRVYSQAYSDQPSGSSEFVVNPARDPSGINQWETDSQTGPNGETMPGKLNNKVADFYHFRVVAQAYALKDATDTNAKPWDKAGDHIAAAQSLRVLQIQSLQLFKYALFYAANAPIGDLDLQTGGTIWVQKGAVHSNGAIYIRGGESRGFYNKNWHEMASGDGSIDEVNAGQSIFLGEKEWPITITGVAGIFRMGKTANQLAANNNLTYKDSKGATVLFDRLKPGEVPTERGRFVSDDVTSRSGSNPLDLNGDLEDSQRHKFNGVAFTRANDSRTPAEFVKAFGNYARDSNNGGTTVRTLQNIPQLGGRPFEPQSVISTVSGTPNPLYGTVGTEISRIPRKADGTLRPTIFYVTDPTSAAGSIPRPRNFRTPAPTAPNAGARQVMAEEMRLWWNPTMTATDVLDPTAEIPLLDQIPSLWGANVQDHERAASYVGNTLVSPTYYAANGGAGTGVGTTGVLSFPGVPFTLPGGLGNDANGPLAGRVWQPGFFGTGFSPREMKGFYLEAALFGTLPVSGTLSKQQQYYQNLGATPTDIAQTGIVIRERRWQQRPMLASMSAPTAMDPLATGNEIETAWNYYWPGTWLPGTSATDPALQTNFLNPTAAGAPGNALNVLPIPRPTLSNPPTAREKLDYVQYLCSQYTVLFCGRNITAPFFGQILSQNDSRDFIITEDEFVDPRESGYMWGMYGANGNTSGKHGQGAVGPDAFYQYEFFPDPTVEPLKAQPGTWQGATGVTLSQDYRQNVLTVHMKGFQDWLRSTPMNQLGYPGDNSLARAHFSGVLYNHRTRRSDSMHPLLAPELDWPGMQQRITNNVETDPQRLVNQTHFRAYWFSELNNPTPTGLPNQTAAPFIYPPINFPWNWREPSGPLETSRCATRLKGQLNDPAEIDDPTYFRVYWNHSTPTSTTDPLGTSAFTYISPQRFYMWGHFCYKVNAITSESLGREEIDQNISSITPCAVFADNYTIQSARWRDEFAQFLPVNGNGKGYPSNRRAESTCQFVSMVINNSPNSAWNCGSFGSAGQEGTFRMMEDWGYSATHVWWSGSQVVMNMGRYHHSGHNFIHYGIQSGRQGAPAHMGIGAFEASTNHYIFNTNLFSRAGRPPLSPGGVTATRVVNSVSSFGE